MDNFVDRIDELMTINGLSNKKLSEKLNITIKTVQNWKNGRTYPMLSQMLKLADFFKCSLEYLIGRGDKVLDYMPKECPPFYERLREVMREKGISRYRMSKDSKIKDSYFSVWAKGADPHILTIIDAANFLEVTVDYLVGRDR